MLQADDLERQPLSEHFEQFELANSFAEDIGRQNTTYNQLSSEVSILPFLEAAKSHLARQQLSSFIDLLSSQEDAPYRDLANESLRLEAALGDSAIKLATIDGSQSQEIKRIHDEFSLITGQLPEIGSILETIKQQLEEESVSEEKKRLETEISQIEMQLARVNEVFETAGQAWPIPQLIDLSSSGEMSSDGLLTIDQFPDVLRRSSAQIGLSVHKKHPEVIKKDASEFLALVLADEPGHVFLRSELGTIMYGENEPNKDNRISALISSYESGNVAIIGKTLEQFGLVLQRGVRSTLGADGHKIGSTHRIFRAIPIAQQNKEERIVRSQTGEIVIDDDWEPVTDNEENSPASNVSEDLLEDQLVLESATYPTDAEAIALPTYAEGVDIDDIWDDFNISVELLIQKMIDSGLPLDQPSTWSDLLSNVPLQAGARAMAKRAARFGLIDRNDAHAHSEVSPAIFILSVQALDYLFSNRSTRQLAETIVEDRIQDYLAIKNHTAK